MTDTNLPLSKQCIYCHQNKPLSEFRRRTGKRSKGQSRRGACRECRKQRETAETKNLPPVAPITRLSDSRSLSAAPQPISAAVPALLSAKPAVVKAHQHSLPERSREGKILPPSSAAKSKVRTRGAEQPRIHPHLRGPKPEPQDTSALIPSAKGLILMRGHSDKGRRWHQEIDFELAVTLVNERAAVVINRRTIRRIYSNKDFRAMILTRDNYTCYFCGLYGDTIDHLLPRAKGGHTTPENCVCACNLCNQTKADQYVEEFMGR